MNMITSKDVRNKRFEKSSFGYNQDEVDEFLSQLEAELDEMERERAEANKKIEILAEKVREYMSEEEALKDALLGAQKQGRQVLKDAEEKAEKLVAEAEAKAANIKETAESEHLDIINSYREAEAVEERNLLETKRAVSNFKKDIFELYKEHLAMISNLPEYEEEEEITPEQEAEAVAEAVAGSVEEKAEEISEEAEKTETAE